MTQLAVVERPLVVDRDGERLTLIKGDIVEDFSDWNHEARTAAVEMERVTVLPELGTIEEVARLYGYKLVPLKSVRN